MGFTLRIIIVSIMRMGLAAAMLIAPVVVQPASAIPEKAPDSRMLALKLQKNISLNDLIQTAGYVISDEDVVRFLADFMELNPSVKSVSTLKKGTVVRLPVKHLRKIVSRPAPFREKAELSALNDRLTGRRSPARLAKQEPLKIDRAMLLRNIEKLFSSLGEDVSLEKEGFKYFALSERTDISFDTGLFPIMDLHNDRVLVIDYTSAFPDDMKNLLEVAWPEYRVVSPRGRVDLRGIVPLLLEESGYHFQENSRMVSGGATQVEYHSDFLVHGKNGTPMDSDISLVSVLDSTEYRTPQELVSWFMKRDIRIIELSEQDRKYVNRTHGNILDMHDIADGKTFIESLLALMGYPYSRNRNINLAANKEIQFNMRADLLIDMGSKRKLVDFSGMSEQEIKHVQRLGLDVAKIEPWENRNDMTRKIMSLLSLNYTNSRQRNSSSLTPRNTRYRLLARGFVVKTLKGVFYLTDTDTDEELLKSITNEGISVVKF